MASFGVYCKYPTLEEAVFMKALFIGGTGQISTAIVKKLAQDPFWEVWMLNRGNRVIPGLETVHQITADIRNEE